VQETAGFAYFSSGSPVVVMMLCLLILSACLLAQCALPPGYEEELYCPPSACLRPLHQKPGLCGRRSMFHECCDETTGETSAPHSWGVKVDASVKDELLQRGWHTAECTSGMCGRKALMRSMLERLTALLLPLVFTEHASAIE